MQNGTYFARSFDLFINAIALKKGDMEFATTLLPTQPVTTLLRSGTLRLDQLTPDAESDSVRCIGCSVTVRVMWGKVPSQPEMEDAVKSCIDRHFSEFEGEIVFK